MVYDYLNRPEECPECGKVQCREHYVDYACADCGKVRKVKVATVAIRPGREAPKHCRSCARKVWYEDDENRQKMSEALTGRFIPPHTEEWKQENSKRMRKQYANGSREPVTCKSSQFYLQYPNGEPFWVQGTYELEYACQLLAQEIEFKAHPKSLKYMKDGKLRTYFPDFYLPQNDEYIDVKSEWTMTDKYFDKIRLVEEQNDVIVTTIIPFI